MSELQSDCLSVLIVEDDNDTVENLCDILAMEGHECRRAATFAEAMTELEEVLPEVIILDRQLPDGVAETFIPKIKRLASDLPIVVVTGFPDIDGAIKTLRQGAYDYLLKPINPDVLLHSLRG